MERIALTQVIAGVAASLCLGACTVTDNAYFVKPDDSPATVAGIAELAELPPDTQVLQLGVTFKSDGKLQPSATDALYQSFRKGLQAKGPWDVQRLGRRSDDFSAQIAATNAVPLTTTSYKTMAAPSARQPPRVLVLIENHPDLSTATAAKYFVSGMTYGGARVHKPTDRYDVTIAYRDPDGVERIYRGHQDLVFATGSKLFGTDPSPGPEYKRFSSSVAAFDGVVDNSVNGVRHGKVTVGAPQAAPAAGASQPQAQKKSVAVRSTDAGHLSYDYQP